jgi:hypothetical protein
MLSKITTRASIIKAMNKDRITAEETAAAISEVMMEVETSKLSQRICECVEMA